jgi:hypothetical protein
MQAIGTPKTLGIAGTTIAHAGGLGSETLWRAAARGETNLRRNDLEWCDLACWVGAVPGVDGVELPASLAKWDCRIHRLAWMALQDPSVPPRGRRSGRPASGNPDRRDIGHQHVGNPRNGSRVCTAA